MTAVESVGMTVSDMDRAVEFYSQVLSFKKVSDVEVLGTEYEQLQGLFGVRLRVVRMQLSNETIELTEYLTPKGKLISIDSHSNERWFQHIAIAVSNMDKAYQHLRSFKVQRASTAPQRIPNSNKAAAGIRAFYFKDPDGHNLEIIYFSIKGLNFQVTLSAKRLCMSNFAVFAKIFVGSYFGKGIDYTSLQLSHRLLVC
ncbi:VOC family protein [Tolypothrix sp. PCC 7910]|uniref:VOC family protein n=1 Tax=Tolypothrix sp. PCC 7910 TaxID=2099387 RepID=UPI001FCAF61A|nr:VOC family protein [Tolypothrix sp. PCC 7910]